MGADLGLEAEDPGIQQKGGKIFVWVPLHPDLPTSLASYISEFNINEFIQQRKQHLQSPLVPSGMVDLHSFPPAVSPGMRVVTPCPTTAYPRPRQEKPLVKTELRPGFRVLPREATQKLTSHLPWRLSTPN